ncbi:MAG: DUF1841 family protein [Zoogloeaceae bacterium]|jgi:hypothetical protein|nr:DUF1841 family protein [Zoogloeaceae bacterium]
MFAPSRDAVRRFFCEVWRKRAGGLPLAGAELAAADIVLRHPEHHALLADPETSLGRDWTPEEGVMNPFLHLSLHLAIAEQLAIDHPPGIRAVFTRLLRRMDAHAAEHRLLETLAETLWTAQRQGQMPDTGEYLENIRRQAAK